MIEPKRITAAPLPPDYADIDALKVVRRLRAHGYVAYLVGGGVRDLLLLVPPKDFDVATSARPEEVRATFRNCRLIGRRFRLAHIHFREGKVIEVSTFRRTPQDVDGEDLMIRDDNVFGTEAEDALRRDFTMNALFYDVEAQTIIDYVGGVADLEARRLRTIGDPVTRLREDPVRILRGVKFAARLNLTLEPAVAEAAILVAPDILRCAPPRILEELLRMLRSGAAEHAFSLMVELGILDVVLPDLARFLRRVPRWEAPEKDKGPKVELPAPPAEAVAEKAPPELPDALDLWRVLREMDAMTAERKEALPDAVLLAALYLVPMDHARALESEGGEAHRSSAPPHPDRRPCPRAAECPAALAGPLYPHLERPGPPLWQEEAHAPRDPGAARLL